MFLYEGKPSALYASSILSLYIGSYRLCSCLANASVNSTYSKFDVYLFNTEGKYNYNKAKLFWDWGYDVDDIPWMKAEWERQSYEKYLAGKYKLNLLDEWGQRINIQIEIPRKDTGEIVSFMSGWLVMPNGKLQLATPYRR